MLAQPVWMSSGCCLNRVQYAGFWVSEKVWWAGGKLVGAVPGEVCADNMATVEPRDLFEILMREHIDSVRAFLLSSVRDSVAVEDLVQETFLTAWKILGRYDRQLPFGPWVRGIAAKLVLNHRRKLGRNRVHFCDEELLTRIDEGVTAVQKLPGDTFDEKVDALRSCLERLTGPQRDSIRLHYENGLHCKEIAERLGIGFEAVKKHLQRGRTQLYRCLHAKIGAVGAGVGSADSQMGEA